MGLAERKAAALARIAELDAGLTDADRAEIAEREAVREIEKQVAEKEQAARSCALDQRMEAARARLGPNKPVMGVLPDEFPDTFVVYRNGAAHARWVKATQGKINGAKTDQDVVNLQYAIDCICDWNGNTDFDTNTELSAKLRKFLTENSGILTPLTDAAAKLAGVFAESRKS